TSAPGSPGKAVLGRLWRPTHSGGGARFLQLERAGVDAEALPGGVGAVVEDVSEVPAATLADDLGALHEKAVVGAELDVLGVLGFVEAGPAGARLKLGPGVEELGAAPRTGVRPVLVGIHVLAGERSLGALLAEHVVLLGGQLRLPLLFCLLDLLLGAHSVLTLVARRFFFSVRLAPVDYRLLLHLASIRLPPN